MAGADESGREELGKQDLSTVWLDAVVPESLLFLSAQGKWTTDGRTNMTPGREYCPFRAADVESLLADSISHHSLQKKERRIQRKTSTNADGDAAGC